MPMSRFEKAAYEGAKRAADEWRERFFEASAAIREYERCGQTLRDVLLPDGAPLVRLSFAHIVTQAVITIKMLRAARSIEDKARSSEIYHPKGPGVLLGSGGVDFVQERKEQEERDETHSSPGTAGGEGQDEVHNPDS